MRQLPVHTYGLRKLRAGSRRQSRLWHLYIGFAMGFLAYGTMDLTIAWMKR